MMEFRLIDEHELVGLDGAPAMEEIQLLNQLSAKSWVRNESFLKSGPIK